MTMRVKVRELYPEAIDKHHDGGIKGCPDNYPGFEEYCPHDGWFSAEDECEECWSQEYRGEPEKKPKRLSCCFFGFLYGCALEAVFAGVSLFRGDVETFQSCYIMALLFFIAAGVWRDKP